MEKRKLTKGRKARLDVGVRDEGALSSLSHEVPTRILNDVSNQKPTKPTYKWDHYSGLPGVEAYMED